MRAMKIVGWLVAASLGFATAAEAMQEPQPTIEQLRQQAEEGDTGAQHALGIELMMRNGEADLVEARRWLRLAMEAGEAEAKNAYGGLLMNGAGGPRDEAEGLRLIVEAAAEGAVGADLTLSMFYRTGQAGLPRDPARAFAHMQSAASRAEGPSAGLIYWQLGMMLLQGVGTAADAEAAYRWVSRSAAAGEVNGMISSGVMLATGEGVAEDDAAAREWYRRASESGRDGYGHALRSLGAMFVTGEGGPPDLARGIAYLRIAHAAGDDQAERLLETWRDRVTPAVDAEARRIADAWMAEHLPADAASQ